MYGLAYIIHEDKLNEPLSAVEIAVKASYPNSQFSVNHDAIQLSTALLNLQSFCRKGVGNRLFLPKKRVSHKPFIAYWYYSSIWRRSSFSRSSPLPSTHALKSACTSCLVSARPASISCS